MSEVGKSGLWLQNQIAEIGGGSLARTGSRGARPKVYFNPAFPEKIAGLALRKWEEEKKRPEIQGLIQSVDKRLFLEKPVLEIEGQRFRVKYYSYRSRPHHWVENFFYQSEAMRNFRMMAYLNSRGVPAPKPLVLAEGSRAGAAFESALIMEDLDPALTYKALVEKLDTNPGELERFLEEVIQSLAQFNRTGIYTLDVDKNILIKRNNGHYQIYHFDFDNVFPFRKNNPRRAGRSIAFLIRANRIHQKISPDKVSALIDLYLGQIGRKEWKPGIEHELKKRLSRKP